MYLRFISTVALTAIIVSIMALAAAAADQPLTTQSFNQMPLAFTKNMGQWDDRVLFRASSGGATMWFTKEGVTYQFTRRIDRDANALVSIPGQAGMPMLPGDRHEKDSVEQLVLSAKFVGGNPNPEVVTQGKMEYRCNYFLGNNETKWRTDVPNYEAITLKDVYPGIDVKYSDGGIGQAAYEFVVASGADISQIQVAYEGVEATTIDADGRLIVQTRWGDMIAAIGSPTQGAGPTSLRLAQGSDNSHGMKFSGQNELQALSEGPVLGYSTYLGGYNDDWGYDIAVNSSGQAFVIGETHSVDFPTLNPYQTRVGGADVFVTKLSSSGNSLIYSTYLGGDGDETGYGIAVDGSGNAYLTGWTQSWTFPTTNYAFQRFYQGEVDAFVTKLNPNGNGLLYSSYLGGEENREVGWDIANDGSGNAYVTGETMSSNFPLWNPYQEHQGGNDAFVTKFSSSGSLIYSTCLGADNDDRGYGIAVDGSGCAYVTGCTYLGSYYFPTLNPFQASFNGPFGGPDAFVTKLSSSGASLVYSTYLGGSGNELGYGITVGSSDNAYVTGYTSSTDFPTANPYQTVQGNGDAFVTQLSNSGSSLSYSTYLGGNGHDEGTAIAIDGGGNAFVTGFTSATNFPTLNGFQVANGGGNSDVFVTKLMSSGNNLIYSSYLGGVNADYGWGIAVDGSSNVYLTGQTGPYFPLVNPYQWYAYFAEVFVSKVRHSTCRECGDANSDGVINVSDGVFITAYIFAGGNPPGDCDYPLGKGDADGNGIVNISDAVYLTAYIFSSGPCPHCQGGPCW